MTISAARALVLRNMRARALIRPQLSRGTLTGQTEGSLYGLPFNEIIAREITCFESPSLLPALTAQLPKDTTLAQPLGARYYSKGKKEKGGKKDKKGGKGKASESDDEDGAPKATSASGAGAGFPELDLKDLETKMENNLEGLRHELVKLRTGRAAPGLLESIPVRAYDEVHMLKELGLVHAKDPQTLSITLYDPSVASAVEKAIISSPLGLNPRVAGDSILVPVPQLSGEDRKEVVKIASQHAEHAKSAVRARRKEAMDVLKQAKKLGRSEDDVSRDEKQVQKITDAMTHEVDAILERKKKELMALV